jgi:O-antigen ligase
VWFTSPYLRGRLIDVVEAIQDSRAGDSPVSAANESQISAALHLSFFKKSIQLVEEAPLVGHGTGSITELYQQSAVGQKGADATVSTNPHNQTLAVAIQLGVIGGVVLYAMWISHAWLMFSLPGQEGWIGSLLVIQNIISSLFNSHLFDFTQGWTYVFGVGIIGGVALQRRCQRGQAWYRHGRDAAAAHLRRINEKIHRTGD